MDLAGLRAALRETIDDVAAPYLWPDDEITRYLNNAVREAALRSRLIKDDADRNPDLCLLPITAGVMHYDFQPGIFAIRQAIITGATERLTPRSAKAMDSLHPGWDNGSVDQAQRGMPREMVMDLKQKSITLWPPPEQDTTLRLRVWRAPDDSEIMEDEDDEPCIELPAPEELKHWAAYECYLKKDHEMYDPNKAGQHESLFTAAFGVRPSFHEMARWADSPRTPANRRTGYF